MAILYNPIPAFEATLLAAGWQPFEQPSRRGGMPHRKSPRLIRRHRVEVGQNVIHREWGLPTRVWALEGEHIVVVHPVALGGWRRPCEDAAPASFEDAQQVFGELLDELLEVLQALRPARIVFPGGGELPLPEPFVLAMRELGIEIEVLSARARWPAWTRADRVEIRPYDEERRRAQRRRGRRED